MSTDEASIFPGPGEVVALVLPLDVPDERFQALAASLSARERQRWDSFKDPGHGRRWATGRGFLRDVLGASVGIGPREVTILYGEHGKPRIESKEGLEFNLSHSGALALLVLARCPVGADIERHKPRRWAQIARRFYAKGEQERVFAPPAEEQETRFFRTWTCKEAFLKCTGEGLGRSLRSYEMEISQSGARLAWARGVDASEYSVFPIDPAPGYSAAAVARGRSLVLRRREWS
ncbi:MAG: 4'-phosphopantetheinyl transferase family protein [Myxococcales bacterium]